MAVFSSLTAEQQGIYLTFEKDLRALAGETQRLFDKYNALNARWSAQMLSILSVLDDNSVVPNSSGLAGSSALDSDAEMAVIRGDYDAILTTYNTSAKQQLRAKACGQLNV